MKVIFFIFSIFFSSTLWAQRPYEVFNNNVARVEKNRFLEDRKEILKMSPEKCLLSTYMGCLITKLKTIDVQHAESMKVLVETAQILGDKDFEKLKKDPSYELLWADALIYIAEKTDSKKLWIARYTPTIPSDKIHYGKMKQDVLRDLSIAKKDVILSANKHILSYRTKIDAFKGQKIFEASAAETKVKNLIDRMNYIKMNE